MDLAARPSDRLTVHAGLTALTLRDPRAHRDALGRARERGSGLVSVGPWEQAAVRLDVVAHRWSGTDAGGGYLRRCELDVARTARGVTDRWTLTLPTPGSPLVEPVEGQARPAASTQRAPLRLVG